MLGSFSRGPGDVSATTRTSSHPGHQISSPVAARSPRRRRRGRLRPPPSAGATRSRSRCRRRRRVPRAPARRSGADRAGRGCDPGHRDQIGGLGEDQAPEIAGIGVGERKRRHLLRQRPPGVQGIERQAAVDAAGQDDPLGQRLAVARRDRQPPLGIQVVRVTPQKHRSPPRHAASRRRRQPHPVVGRVFAENGYRGWTHCATYPPRAPLIPTFPHGYPQRRR